MEGKNPVIVKELTVGILQANCYLLADENVRQAAIIDPGGDGEMIQSVIEGEKWKPVALINTHGHIDHIAANAWLKKRYDVPLLIHGKDAISLTDTSFNLGIPGLGSVASVPADRDLSDGDEIRVGSLRLEVIFTPGHSPGSICLLLPRSGEPDVVFTGDTLFAGGIGRTDFPGGSMAILMNSIKARLLTLPDRTIICPGHGPASTIGRERTTNPFLL